MSDEIGPGGVTADDLRWETEAIELQHSGLASVRATAAAWSSSIAALLGIFSVVAFVKGPEAISSLRSNTTVVTILVLVAAALASAAVLTAAWAAQGVPRWLDRLDGRTLRVLNREAAKEVIRLLWISRVLAIVAALSVLAGMSVAWLSPRETGKSQAVLIVTRDGHGDCGILTAFADGRIGVSHRGKPSVRLTLGNITQLTPVDKCP
jgi:hypothetical protein